MINSRFTQEEMLAPAGNETFILKHMRPEVGLLIRPTNCPLVYLIIYSFRQKIRSFVRWFFKLILYAYLDDKVSWQSPYYSDDIRTWQ